MATAKSTKAAFIKRYRATPKGAAARAWNRLTSRAGAKYGHRQCYKRIKVCMTREAFVAWAEPQYEAWFRERPGVPPSVDRKDSKKHYAIGNLQLIPVAENRAKNSRHRNKFAPKGQRWCCRCQDYRAIENFHTAKAHINASNPRGCIAYCKPCNCAKLRAAWHRRKR